MPLFNERCALRLLNAAALAGSNPVAQDICYAEEAYQCLDVYAPNAASLAPVVVFFHGGGWETGAKEDDRFVAGALVRRGLVAITLNYGLYPDALYPAFLQDAAKAVAWAKAHVARYGGDPNRIVLCGHSAGAYIAAMLSLNRRWLNNENLDPRRDIAAWIGLAGAYDFLPLRSTVLKAIFGPPEDWFQTQPIAHATGEGPPALLATGRHDKIVDPGDTMRLARRVRAAGGEAEVIIYSKLSHKSILAAFARPLSFLSPVVSDISDFVAEFAQPTTG
jgi:acetyl esterase/lipase